MLKLRLTVNEEEIVVPLVGADIHLGRAGENEVVLPDYSVSRRHAVVREEAEGWMVVDLQSTNGIQVNQAPVQKARLKGGDELKIGVFEIAVEGQEQEPTDELNPTRPVPPPPPAPEMALSNATIIRSLSEFNAEYGLDPGAQQSSSVRQDKRRALDEVYASQVFGFLTRLARLLITTDEVDEVLRHVMEIAFEVLPVDRGFLLLRDEESSELKCVMMRVGDRIDFHPRGEIPISHTMLEAVMRERVALLTFDALSDQRLAGTESIRIHQIRAAMCAPLWSGEKIIGVMQLDTPHHTGSFTEQDVDLVTALANYCAVAIERIRNARVAEFERQVRSRLERYHSPAVIEEVLQEDDSAAEEGIRLLKPAEVSILFADIVGFTAYSENSPPREVAELMEGYFNHAVEAIFSAGGTLDKFIGDCVMAFFGAPMAQEDHAYRAVNAAVRIRRALQQWNEERRQAGLMPIASRIGINSGPVVVGDIGSHRRVDYTVLGNTVNVAARLEEAVAKPGEIVIGSETYRQIDGLVPVESLGEIQLKGLSKSIAAYRVLWQ